MFEALQDTYVHNPERHNNQLCLSWAVKYICKGSVLAIETNRCAWGSELTKLKKQG